MSSVFSSWTNLRRTPYQSLTALLAVITTFFMFFVLSDLIYIGERILHYFETQPEVLVFFDVAVSDAEATAAAELIRQLDYVEAVSVTGKSDAFANYQRDNADEPLLLGLLSAELFPASLSIQANSPEGLEKVRQEIEKIDGIDEIDYHQDVVAEFLGWTGALRQATIAVGIVFTIQFVLVIAVITGMKVAARRRTLNIMSILGASRSAIKGTFIREAMWLGALGSAIAFGLSYAALEYLRPPLSAFLGEIPVFPLPEHFFALEAAIGIGVAVLLSALSAWLASGKLIKK